MAEIVGKTCPFCQTTIQQSIPALNCPSCGMPHHRDCWDENGGCTTFGCSGRPPEVMSRTTQGASSRPRTYQRGRLTPLPPQMLYRHDVPSQLGLAAMVLGILSLFFLFIYIGWFPALLAIILGAQARKTPSVDYGMAGVGVILGIVSIAATILLYMTGFSIFNLWPKS